MVKRAGFGWTTDEQLENLKAKFLVADTQEERSGARGRYPAGGSLRRGQSWLRFGEYKADLRQSARTFIGGIVDLASPVCSGESPRI